MAVVKGDDVDLLWGGTAVEDCTANGFNGSVNGIPVTSYDSGGFDEMQPGTLSGTMNISYLCDYGATEGFSQMLADFLAKTTQTALLDPPNTGDVTISASAYVSDLTWSGSQNNPGVVQATLQLTGTITQGTKS